MEYNITIDELGCDGKEIFLIMDKIWYPNYPLIYKMINTKCINVVHKVWTEMQTTWEYSVTELMYSLCEQFYQWNGIVTLKKMSGGQLGGIFPTHVFYFILNPVLIMYPIRLQGNMINIWSAA